MNEEFDKILKESDDLGILSEVFKQQDSFIREKSVKVVKSEFPWDPNSNITIQAL